MSLRLVLWITVILFGAESILSVLSAFTWPHYLPFTGRRIDITAFGVVAETVAASAQAYVAWSAYRHFRETEANR